MIGYISVIILVISTFFGVFSGTTDDILSSLLSGGLDTLNFCFRISGSIFFFSGLMNLAKKSGLTKIFSRILSPLIRILFPVASKDPEIEQCICMNIASNFFGLGNAATPIGIKAVELMKKRNNLTSPDRNVSLFVILNTVSLTLIPTTVASVRSSAGAVDPFSVSPYIFIVQTVSCLIGIVLSLLLCRDRKDRG